MPGPGPSTAILERPATKASAIEHTGITEEQVEQVVLKQVEFASAESQAQRSEEITKYRELAGVQLERQRDMAISAAAQVHEVHQTVKREFERAVNHEFEVSQAQHRRDHDHEAVARRLLRLRQEAAPSFLRAEEESRREGCKWPKSTRG